MKTRFMWTLIKDDFLLLCSDGITDMLSDDEIALIFAQYARDVVAWRTLL
ncbi:MAG TPA: hypothetical protein VEF34_09825 [Syntrophobacteraceae bacterium]|nr:hypothetical protein [Syntrophobacteraceae bacterium]